MISHCHLHLTIIGKLLNPSKSVESIWHIITQLDNDTKYSLLYDHLQPPSILPYSTIRGSNRKFNVSWLSKYPWLKYSPMLDGVFCGPCSLLLCSSERRDKGILVNKAFNNWSKLSTTLLTHSTLKYHHRCMQDAEILKSTIETPQSRIDVSISTTLSQRIQDNKLIIHQIVRAILFLAKQGLPFRGDHEDLSLDKNPGNFLAILKILLKMMRSYANTSVTLEQRMLPIIASITK